MLYSDRAVDLRSDTAIQPTEAMVASLQGTSFFDELLQEDTCTNDLVGRMAEIFDKPSAILTPTGSMSNQIAVIAHASNGDEIIVGQGAHIYELERGGLAANAGVQARVIDVSEGIYDIEGLESALRKPSLQVAPTKLVCLEATFDLNRGFVTPLDNLAAIAELAREHEIPVYMDGARIFNSSIALGVEPWEICQYVDAVQVCLNKGLGAPLGSVLVGDTSFIAKAREIRQRLGGGMRHTGWIAAPALVALNDYKSRLAEDHRKGVFLATAIHKSNGLTVTNTPVATNIVNVAVEHTKGTAEDFAKRASEQGVLVKVVGAQNFRAVTHSTVSWAELKWASEVLVRV